MKDIKFQSSTEPTADLHTHSQASLDASKPVSYLLKKARTAKNSILAVSDHNTLKGVNHFLDRKGYSRQAVMELMDSKTIFLPAVEITCRISEIQNLKGNPTKIHMLAYGLDRDEESFISQLLSIKHENDGKVDRGMLTQFQKHFNLDINDNEIIKYIMTKRKQEKGFGAFGKNDVFEFSKFLKLQLTGNDQELREIIHNFKPIERLNLEAEDVINFIHASGGIAILAHPYTNLKRTPYPKVVIEYLLAKDIDGFELYHPYNTQPYFDLIQNTIKEHSLLTTGGSDYHDDNMEWESFPHHIPYSDPTVKQVRQFVDEMNELKYKREQGKLMTKNYAGVRGFNPVETIKKYKAINNRINETANLDDFLM